MRIILKPAGATVVLIAFGLLISLLVFRDGKGAKATSSSLPAPVKQVASGTKAELLRNAEFESDYQPVSSQAGKGVLSGVVAAPWRDDSSWAQVDATYAQDRKIHYRGNSSQKITVLAVQNSETKLDTVQLVQELPLTVGTSYAAKVWVRADRAVPVTLTLRQAGEPFTSYATQTVTVGKEWQQITIQGKVTQKGNSFLMLNVATAATVWVDESSLVAQP